MKYFVSYSVIGKNLHGFGNVEISRPTEITKLEQVREIEKLLLDENKDTIIGLEKIIVLNYIKLN